MEDIIELTGYTPSIETQKKKSGGKRKAGGEPVIKQEEDDDDDDDDGKEDGKEVDCNKICEGGYSLATRNSMGLLSERDIDVDLLYVRRDTKIILSIYSL